MTDETAESPGNGVILEAISSITKADAELSMGRACESISESRIDGLKLRMALLTRKLSDLRSKARDSDTYITKLRCLTSQVRNENVARCERLRQRDFNKNLSLVRSLPNLEESLDQDARTLRELNNAIQAEEERNRRLRARASEYAEARLPDAAFTFSDTDKFMEQSDAFVDFLKFLDPSLGEEDPSSRQTHSSDSESPASGYTESESETS